MQNKKIISIESKYLVKNNIEREEKLVYTVRENKNRIESTERKRRCD